MPLRFRNIDTTPDAPVTKRREILSARSYLAGAPAAPCASMNVTSVRWKSFILALVGEKCSTTSVHSWLRCTVSLHGSPSPLGDPLLDLGAFAFAFADMTVRPRLHPRNYGSSH